jgi:glycosyltransferase involved in cell wall biosynthesis
MSDQPIRILYVNNCADFYGASRSLVRLLKQLDRSRFVPLVVLPEAGPLQQMITALGVEVVVHPWLSVVTREAYHSWRLLWFLFRYPLSVLFLWRLIRRRRVDLVHTNTGITVSPALAAWLAGVPHLWHIREWFQEFRSVWRPYACYITALSRRVIAVSEAIAAQFSYRRKVLVLHNGFTLEEFKVPKEQWRAEVRERFGLGQAFVVGCVGRIKFVRKGQEFLVQAASRLRQKGRQVRYLIVGSAAPGNESHLTELRRMIRELGLEEQVVLAGEMADPRPAYAAMDVCVLPSAQPEPFGGVVMEAMAMGLPVIATRLGGSIDQVAEGETGFLVPPGDPAALAEKIEQLMDDPSLRTRLGQAGPERIARCFLLADKVRELEQIYTESVRAR